jgi:ABC-2 type transport system ATP-binding protein
MSSVDPWRSDEQRVDVVASPRTEEPAYGGAAVPRTDGIVASGISRSFGNVHAVRDIGLTAEPGEVTALIGPNGAGKTTLLLVLATLLTPDAGVIRIAGHDPVTEPRAVRARMGWSPDVFGLYEALTVREYLGFVAAAYRLPRRRADARTAELLAMARLDAFADRPVHVLSRGQKQRLGLCRAMVHDPAVLLLDEPAAGLDPRSRVDLRELLRRLAAQGKTVLVSSHVLADLEEVADKAVFVDGGVTVGEHRVGALPATTATRTWRLRSLDMPALLGALDRNHYDRDEPTPAGVDVRLRSDADAVALIAGLVGDRVPLVSCAPVGGALEAAFLELTERQA